LHEDHVEALKVERDYVMERYQAVARTLAPKPFSIPREAAAGMIGRCLRQLFRVLKRFKAEGIPGLRHRSRRPRNSPNKTPEDIEDMIVAVREASGFGPAHVSALVNESLEREGRPESVCPSLAYGILVRNEVIERQRRERKDWIRFEWGHPNRLIQADLTKLNTVPILTMEDDHSRKGWAMTLKDQKDKTVRAGMENLVQHQYDNLLTDNGSQFSRLNSEIRKYCDEFVREKHIWTSVHHPETMGKLSAFQKGLKLFVGFKMKGSRNRRRMDRWIRVYVDWYNNGRYHQGIKTRPESRYSGQCDGKWYERLVKSLKLTEVLTVARRTGDISP
jgi:hypothetical protein